MIQIVPLLWTIGGTVAITLAVTCGVVWLIERRDRSSLMLCILGIATAASAYCELGMMTSATTAEYGEWLRWYHLPIGSALVAMLLFVHFYLGTGRVWLMRTIILARVVLILVNFSVEPNVTFSSIASLRSVSLFGEEVSAIGVATPREWQWLAVASLILLMAYLFDAVAQQWHKGGSESRRKAVAVALGIAVPLLGTIIYTQLIVFGALLVPASNLPWFLGALAVMASELGRDFVVSRRERLELAELRVRLAQTDRVSVMGQLATTLAHELTQPLAATVANVETARAELKRENPDLGELDAILDDIGRDDRRAVAIINRMRQFYKRGAIAMQPLSVEELIQDVVSLVRSEATSKNVVMRLLVQPGLPRVLGDRVHLTQVLINLLMNSIQAMQSRPPDSRRIVVEARAAGATGEIEMAVKDSGPGIPDSMAAEVFKPFVTTKPDGMGMGLALSHAIIEAHGGRMWSDQNKGQDGAVFRFTLRKAVEPQSSSSPVARSDLPDEISVHRTSPTTT